MKKFIQFLRQIRFPNKKNLKLGYNALTIKEAVFVFITTFIALVCVVIILGKLNSFVAVTQGKMKLKGQLGQLAKWYVPFNRLFELFKQVKIK